ncbi:Uncharacterized protein BP5553_06415 [Venustampulla echinocandica]|uniref:NADP-dependent oxidoreductase domain-containing protein n=1 Tax=Venustampulla echinocandica TaxID=2656787 RepID=A0A370TJV2_9HELO|nr:Uncharacterized protein BP5553_06415 [Venustampulla echinocandica]RDL35803.1 Uncharacterized protein BP5553_06415 [Venustampulla echinocandica]
MSQHQPEIVKAVLDDCLQGLGLDYLDLYLIHFPASFVASSRNVGEDLFPLTGKNEPEGDVAIDDSVSIVDTWEAMTMLPKSKTRSIEVSNFTIQHLETIINAAGVAPAANQVEHHPLLRQDDLIAYCKNRNIHIIAYSIGGQSVIPKSVISACIRENFQEVILSPQDIAEVESVGKVQKRYNAPFIANKPRWDVNSFGDDAEKNASHHVIL